MIMKIKIFYSLLFLALFFNQVQAQGGYSIKITPVYPAGGEGFSDAYNLPSELDAAEKNLRTQFSSGKLANYNYIMAITTPAGTSKKEIQNISWILEENGKKEHCAKENCTDKKIGETYTKITTIKVYECDINGAPKNKAKIDRNYNLHYKFYEGESDKTGKETDRQYYYDRVKCKTAAQSYFDKSPKADSVLYQVKIFENNDAVDSISNRTEYESFLAGKKAKEEQARKEAEALATANKQPEKPETTPVIDTVDVQTKSCEDLLNNYKFQLKNAKEKAAIKDTALSAVIDCVEIDSIYDKGTVDKNLKLCQETVKEFYTETISNAAIVAKKLEAILTLMEENSKGTINFNRDKYFKKSISKVDIQKGITDLININNKLKESTP